jgi:hypothetical protein
MERFTMTQNKRKLSSPTVKSNASKLHTSVYEFCKQRFPLYTIIQEMPIYGDNKGLRSHLFIDIFIKELGIAIECNGEQHYSPSAFFFCGSYGFKKAQENDRLKKEWCEENGYKLVIFRFDDKLDYKMFNKIIDKALIGE